MNTNAIDNYLGTHVQVYTALVYRVGRDGRAVAAGAEVRVRLALDGVALLLVRPRTGAGRGGAGASGGGKRGLGLGLGARVEVADGGAHEAVVRGAEREHFEQAPAVVQELLRHARQRAARRQVRQAALVEHQAHLRRTPHHAHVTYLTLTLRSTVFVIRNS